VIARSIPNRARVLVVKPSSLGDVVHTLPVVAALKDQRPDLELSWLINPEWAPLLDGNPHLDDVLLFPRRDFRGLAGMRRAVRWAKQIRRAHAADLILDFQCLLRSALIARLCRAPKGKILGLSDGREGSRLFYDAVADVSGRGHAVDRYFALAEMLGIARPPTLTWPLPEGSRPPGLPAEIAPASFVLLHPFSRGEGKSLSSETAMRYCADLSPIPVVLAGRADVALPESGTAINLLNHTSLGQLIWLLRNARFVVSVDSGPMHIAAALGTPLLSIHTWSDPSKVGPYRDEAWIWKDGQIARRGQGDAEDGFSGICALADVGTWTRRLLSRGQN
jgi:heptosyltransferase-1